MLKINLELNLKLFLPQKNNLQKKLKSFFPHLKPTSTNLIFFYTFHQKTML